MRWRLVAALSLALRAAPALAHDPDARLAELARTIEAHPDDARARLERARLLRLSGEPAIAFPDADRAVSLTGAGAEALAERGLCLESLGHRARALADLDAALLARPADPFLRLARSRVHEAAARWEPALADLDAALESRPEPDLFLDRSRIIHRKHGIERAIESLADAHRRTGAPLLLSEKLRLEREGRLWAQALATAATLHDAAVDDPEATLEWARALGDAGRSAASAQAFERAERLARARLERRPTALAELVLAKVLSARGRHAEALSMARDAARSAEGWQEAADFVRSLEAEVAR